MPAVEVSVVVVSFNTRELLGECLRSLRAAREEAPLEVWVVDNASADGSADLAARDYPEVHLIRNQRNLGFAAANNQALRAAAGRFLLLLNSDAALLPGSLRALRAAFDRQPSPGICGPRLLNPDGSVQPSWGDFPTPTVEFLFQSFLFKLWPARFPYGRRVHPLLRAAYGHGRPVDWVTGAALMMRREVFERVGGLPEDSFMYGEDLEFCARARRAGFGVAFVPEARVVHHLRRSSHRDYAGWIENYTRAVLAYYGQHGSAADRRRVARFIVWGSALRRVLWAGVGAVDSSRRAEARARREGYARAAAQARRTLGEDGARP